MCRDIERGRERVGVRRGIEDDGRAERKLVGRNRFERFILGRTRRGRVSELTRSCSFNPEAYLVQVVRWAPNIVVSAFAFLGAASSASCCQARNGQPEVAHVFTVLGSQRFIRVCTLGGPPVICDSS